MKTIHFPTELWVGEGALANLETLHDRRVFIVTDPFMVDSGFVNEVTKHLTKVNGKFLVTSSPIHQLIRLLRELSS